MLTAVFVLKIFKKSFALQNILSIVASQIKLSKSKNNKLDFGLFIDIFTVIHYSVCVSCRAVLLNKTKDFFLKVNIVFITSKMQKRSRFS